MRRSLWIGLALAVGTVALYAPALRCQFLAFDDPVYVAANRHVQAGPTLESLAWAFRTTTVGNWHPLTMLSHELDCQIYGLRPWGHHLTNVLLHAANGVLLFLVLLRLTGAVWRSAGVAALFAVHPAHVESVAWVAERKDVLSSFFCLLAVWAYIRYADEFKVHYGRANLSFWTTEGNLASSVPSPRASGERDRERRLSQNSKTEKSVKNMIAAFAIWRAFILSEGVLMVFFKFFGGEFRVLRQSQRGFPKSPSSPQPSPPQVCGGEGEIQTAQISRYTHYGLCLVFFVLALMAKPMAVTLPFVLLLLDFWPLERVRSLDGPTWRRLALEKWPMLALSALWCGITIWAQRVGQAVASAAELSVWERIPHVMISYLDYVRVLVWPSGLAAYYPFPHHEPVLWGLVAGAALALMTWLALAGLKPRTYLAAGANLSIWTKTENLPLGVPSPRASGERARERGFPKSSSSPRPSPPQACGGEGEIPTAQEWRCALAVGWLWFLGMLVPVIGLVQVGGQGWADRYVYLPSIGFFVAVVWGLAEGAARIPAVKLVIPLAVVALAAVTWTELPYWKDTRTLFERAMQVTDNNYLAMTLVGTEDEQSGRRDEAIGLYRQALACKPAYPEAHFLLGRALESKGRTAEAMSQYREALRLEPDSDAAHIALGLLLAKEKKFEEAVAHYQAALKANPESASAQGNWGLALMQQGRWQESAAHYEQAVRLDPTFAEAHGNLAIDYLQTGRLAEGTSELRAALKLNPGDAEIRFNLGQALNQQGQWLAAAEFLQPLATSQPTNFNVQFQYGLDLENLGQTRDAMSRYEAALRQHPDFPEALQHCAWIAATDARPEWRDGTKAVAMAARACELTGQGSPSMLLTLAAAYAETGRFADALATVGRAEALARQRGQKQLEAEAARLQKLFAAGQPFRGQSK